MPVEIKELTIKVNVNQDQNKNTDSTRPGAPGSMEDKEAMINEAVEEVLRILESKKER